MAVLMKDLAVVIVDQTTPREVGTGANATLIELDVDLPLAPPLSVALHRTHPIDLVARSATGSARLPSTVFIEWTIATKVAILLHS